MGLPSEICLRSTSMAEVDDNRLDAYHIQYQIRDSLVNVVVLATDADATGPRPLEDEWLWKLHIASAISDDEESHSLHEEDRLDDMIQQIEEWIETVCESALRKILAAMETNSGFEVAKSTLEALLSPSIINLQLKTIDGEVAVIRHEGIPPWPKNWNLGYFDGIVVQPPIMAEVPLYDSSEVVIHEKAGVHKVLVNGQILRCKLNRFNTETLRESETYRKLSTLKVHNLKVPALKGYVVRKNKPGMVGLLLEDIVTDKLATHSLAFGPFVHEAADIQSLPAQSDPTPEFPVINRRRKWARQIRETVKVLHENDIVWGDVKPANVLIDVNDNAWVLDFGGGITRPWKSLADAETILGDLKALSLIDEYLETGIMPLLPSGSPNDGQIEDDAALSSSKSQQEIGQPPEETTEETQVSHGKRKHRSYSPQVDNSDHT